MKINCELKKLIEAYNKNRLLVIFEDDSIHSLSLELNEKFKYTGIKAFIDKDAIEKIILYKIFGTDKQLDIEDYGYMLSIMRIVHQNTKSSNKRKIQNKLKVNFENTKPSYINFFDYGNNKPIQNIKPRISGGKYGKFKGYDLYLNKKSRIPKLKKEKIIRHFKNYIDLVLNLSLTSNVDIDKVIESKLDIPNEISRNMSDLDLCLEWNKFYDRYGFFIPKFKEKWIKENPDKKIHSLGLDKEIDIIDTDDIDTDKLD